MPAIRYILNQNKYTRTLMQIWSSEDVAQHRLQFVSAFVVFMSLIFLFIHPQGILTTTGALCTLWAFAVGCFYCFYITEAPSGASHYSAYGRTRTTSSTLGVLSGVPSQPSLARLALFFLLGFSPLMYFEGSNAVNRFRFQQLGVGLLYDRFFLEIDTQLLGRFFPRGQVSLFLDLDPVIGVTSFIGRCLTEVLQIAYCSYYFWGNALLLYLAYMYFREKQVHVPGQSPLTQHQQWRRLILVLAAWVSTYMLNFLLNLIFPAVSPRIFIADDYKNPVRGILIADYLRSATANAAANSFSAFPSGHCGLSWLAVAMARAVGFPRYYIVTLIAAITITAATLALRYHYVIDAIAAIVLYKFGVFVGFLDSPELFHLAVTQSSTGQSEASYTGHPSNGKFSRDGSFSDAEGVVTVRVLTDEDDLSDV